MTDNARPPVPRRADTRLEDLLPLQQALGPDYPEIWQTIAECVFLALGAHATHRPLDTAPRVELAVFVVDTLRAELGGQQPYLPMGNDPRVDQRYRDLYARSTGRNMVDLAAHAGCSVRHLYRVFDAIRREEIARRQRGFDFGDAS